MPKFGIGDKIKKSDGVNTYEVIATTPNERGCYYHLHCIEYFQFEDLGDGLGVYGFDQCIWISNFFDYMLKLA